MSEIHSTIDALRELKLDIEQKNYYAANHYWFVLERAEAAEAAEAGAAELAAQLATAQAALEQVTKERDALKKKYDRACNYDFLNEALNSGDGVYRP